jgi:hypothetical protein
VAINISVPGSLQVFASANIPEKFTLVHHYFEDSPHNDSRFWFCTMLLASFSIIFVGIAVMILKTRSSS